MVSLSMSQLSNFFTLKEGVLNRFRYFHFLVAFISADWELCVGEDKKMLYCCVCVALLYVIRLLLEPCEKVLMRVEKDEVTSNENCYQKDAELCGPRNCKVIKTWH